MCYYAFLASSKEIPEVTNENGIFIAKIEKAEQNVRKMFTTPYVYAMYSSAGCACGIYHDVKIYLEKYRGENIIFELYFTELHWSNTGYDENLLKDERIEIIY